ncbi:putative MerR family transcriptional regulator [Sphingobium sp. SYK-6]|nr:putative MerR family transcriptional regulator [Sphingobium sp. SYK-6]
MAKDDGAFLTIGELARELGVAQHILRYWETRFPQLRPLQRSGNRRYYRPRDVEIARRINRLLNEEGFTVKGAQRALAGRSPAPADMPGPTPSADGAATAPTDAAPALQQAAPVAPVPPAGPQGVLPIGDLPVAARPAPRQVAQTDLALLIARLTVIRQNLADAIEGA